MKVNKNYGYLLFLAGIMIFFAGCKTSRQTTSIALSKMSKEERIESIKYQAIPFNTLSSSMRFSIKPGANKSSTSANAQLRIVKDQVIQLSLRIPILGTEVARLSVTPERVTVIDRANRRYFTESIKVLRETSSFDFDFYNLQALFTNHLFIAGKSSISHQDYNVFKWTEDEFFTKLNITDNQGINYDFTSDYTNRIVRTEIYQNKNDVNLKWLYSDFGLASNNRLFPMKMNMELTIPNDLITLNLSLNSVDIDTSFQVDTSIPNNFQQIGFEQIIKLIQSL